VVLVEIAGVLESGGLSEVMGKFQVEIFRGS
jgi:hypothetical protein